MVVQSLASADSFAKEKAAVARRGQTFELIRSALESHGIDSEQSFAILAIEIKRYLDELLLGSQSRQVSEIESQDSSLKSSTERPAQNSQCGTGVVNDERTRESSTRSKAKQTGTTYLSHQRGRSMIPRGGSRYSTTPYPLVAQVRDAIASDTEEEELAPMKTKRVYKCFRIDDKSQVENFLASRLKRMQQLADKKIAKAWIKGICPKKQANFPYQNNRREEQSGLKPTVPGWWPDTNTVCRFIEPDHIKRDERMKLCLHLLRLRPSPEKLKDWNQAKSEPHSTHVDRGWTAFLQELAGNEIFDELPKENKERTLQRQQLMREMYQVAAMEEEFYKGERDGNDHYEWFEDEEDRKLLPTKRSRQLSTVSSAEQESRESSVSASCTRSKKTRRGSFADASTAFQQPVVSRNSDIDMPDSHVFAEGPILTRKESLNVDGHHPASNDSTGRSDARTDHLRSSVSFMSENEGRPTKMETGGQGHSNGHHHQWHNSSQWMDDPHPFGAAAVTQFVPTDPYHSHAAISTFPGTQNYEFPHFPQSPNVVQVRQFDQVPEPQFQTLPMTPLFSPSSVAPMPIGNFMPQNYEMPPEQPCASGMPPNQYFMPAHQGGHVEEFHAPISIPQQTYHESQHEMVQQHTVPVMQYHGQPYPQPTSWSHR